MNVWLLKGHTYACILYFVFCIHISFMYTLLLLLFSFKNLTLRNRFAVVFFVQTSPTIQRDLISFFSSVFFYLFILTIRKFVLFFDCFCFGTHRTRMRVPWLQFLYSQLTQKRVACFFVLYFGYMLLSAQLSFCFFFFFY